MKLIGIIGEPATGKTALMRSILRRLGLEYMKFKFGLLRGRAYTRDRYVLGLYNDHEIFAGTDKLSMAVYGDAIKFLKTRPATATVAFEGDRLTRHNFLSSVTYDELQLFHIVCSEDERDRRHKARGDTQPRSFTQSRRTLIAGILARYKAIELSNETAGELERNADQIADSIGR
jgi:hypothetical protein